MKYKKYEFIFFKKYKFRYKIMIMMFIMLINRLIEKLELIKYEINKKNRFK